MEDRKFILSQTVLVLAGELILSAVMVALFALLGHYGAGVLPGAVAGSLIAALNHMILVSGVVAASRRAEKHDVKGGQAAIQLSYMGRLTGLFLILVLCAKSGRFNLLALVVPLLFTRPILSITDHFSSKKGSVSP